MMFRRHRDATHRLYAKYFGPVSILAIIILWLSIIHATHSAAGSQIHETRRFVGPNLPTPQTLRFSSRMTKDQLRLYDIVDRLNAAATLRSNMLTLIGRVLLLRLDEESRIAFEEVYEALRNRHVSSYDYLALAPVIQSKTSGQQLRSVLRLMEMIATPYVSSYAILCLESLSDGRVNLELTSPTDLMMGIDNATKNSLAFDKNRNSEVPFTLEEAVAIVMNSVGNDLVEPDLELVAALMLNLPNFDFTNPEVPETMRYVAKYMRENSKPSDPILESFRGDQMSGAEKLVKVVLERILISESASSVLREAVGRLLNNFRVSLGNAVKFRTWNATELFNVVAPDFYPRSVVAIAKYFQKNLSFMDPGADLSPYTTELQALGAVVRQLAENSSLPEPVKETAATLGAFISQKEREEDPQLSIEDVGVDRALEYLNAFRSPCLPEKLRNAAEVLRHHLDDKLPWNYAFGDTRVRGNPHELMVNAMINLKNIDVSEELGKALDNFIYQARYSGVTGKSALYDDGIIFQREDSDLVELDVYSILVILPGVYQDERFTPMLIFLSNQNLIDYLGRGFNMFAHTEPRGLMINLIKTASDKPEVRKNEELYKALKVSMVLLEEPTVGNRYSSEELKEAVKVLPGVDVDPRYLPIKLLFRKEYLFRYISPSFSLSGLKTPLQHIALILNTVSLKPIDKRLEESIIFTLTNLDGPQLPARSFNRDDFAYLVSHLLRRDKKLESTISKSQIYKTVSKWNITVSGTPEDVLARVLTYPVEDLSKSRKISAAVEKAVNILEGGTRRRSKPLDKKILDEMLKYLPNSPDLRPVNLLINRINLGMFMHMNASSLPDHPARNGLINILKNLMASPQVKKKTLLSKRVKMTLQYVEKSSDDPMLKEDANPAFQDSGISRVIGDDEVLEVLSLLPEDPRFSPLKKLLTPSWIRDILPQDFRSEDYPSKEQILRIILFLTKQRPEVIENPVLMSQISEAESSLVSWKRDVEPLRRIVSAVKDALYDPVEELLRPENLNKLNINFNFDSKRTPKQLMVGLLRKLMLNRKVNTESQVVRLLNGLRRDVTDFGLDSDLLWVLDDAGIPYEPSLAPVRLFLHTTTATNRLRRPFGRVTDPEERFKILMDLLSTDKLVRADEKLLKSVNELAEIEPSFNNPLGVTEADVMDIVDVLPNEVVKNYPEVQKLFGPETLKELPSYSAILDSGQPVTKLLLELSQLPKVFGNQKLSADVVKLYKALGNVVHRPVISGYNLRPLLRELNHARQINVDYIQEVIDPKTLSMLLPNDFDDFGKVQDDAKLLNNILDEVLSQNVFDVDVELKKHVSAMQRDLGTILRVKKKNLLSDKEVEKMLKLVPKSAKFKAVRHFIKGINKFDKMPQSIGTSEYPTPLKRLMKILDLVERHSKNDDHLHASAIALKAHLIRKYFFVNENDVSMLKGAISGLSVDDDLVPLRLFLTVENLAKYLPSDIHFGSFRSPREALNVVLHILKANKRLKTNTTLQESIATAIAAVQKKSYRKAEETESKNLTIYDLRFILNLDLGNSILKLYLKPEVLVSVLPESFSFASKPTFKAKVLHLLNYMMSNNLGPKEEIENVIKKVILLNDLPEMNSVDLQRVITAIEKNVVGVNYDVIKRYLTVRKLANILPGNFHIANDNKNIRDTVIELVQMVLNSLSETERHAIAVFKTVVSQLQKLSSPMIMRKAGINLTQLKFLIADIPFKACPNIRNLSEYLLPAMVQEMLPVDFNVDTFWTRKLKLLEILKVIKKHSDACLFKNSIEAAEKCVETLPDNRVWGRLDIRDVLNYTDLDERDVDKILDNCLAADLSMLLPKDFNLGQAKSIRFKLEAIVDNCQKLEHDDNAVYEALKKAKTFTDKLPLLELTGEELRVMLAEICCCEYTAIKPFIVFAATHNLIKLLPITLNLDSEPTVKHKLLVVLTTLRDLDEFKSKEMVDALNTAEKTARALRDKPIISLEDIEDLKKHPAMMLPEVETFAKVFTLDNLLKVVPPSFDINDYEFDESKLVNLIAYSIFVAEINIDDNSRKGWNVVNKWLIHEAEQQTLQYIEEMSKYDEQLTPLRIHTKANKDTFFNNIYKKHGFEYENMEDRVRVVLDLKLRLGNYAYFQQLVKSIEYMMSMLSVSSPTEYEILLAIDNIPNINETRDMKIYLHCPDVVNQAKGLTLKPENTLIQLTFDILGMIESTPMGKPFIEAIEITTHQMQRSVRDAEIEESFKRIPNFKAHMKKLVAVKSYYILNGPMMIFGPDYHHSGSSDKLEMLKKLVKTLRPSPDLSKDEELRTGVEYLNEVLTNPEISTSPEHKKTLQDVDIKSMLSVLPKMKSEELIFGLLKFFTDPKLYDTIGAGIDPSKYESQGSLMKRIVEFGLRMDKVKKDPAELKALKYVREKILVTGAGSMPIKLRSLSKYSRMNPDLIGLLKSVDIRSANLSNVMPIAKFFDTEYDPLIHGRGFDHQAHHTRGAYLRALLKHLIANSDVPNDVKRTAKVLVKFVKLDGPGAEPVDLREDTTPQNRVSHDASSRANPPGGQPPDVSPHFESHPQDPWEKVSAVEPAQRSLSKSSPFEHLMENRIPSPFEDEISSLKTSIDRILNFNRRTRKISKREVREDVFAASHEEPFDPETATFSPDKVLVDVSTRLVKEPFNLEPDVGDFITEDEAAKLVKEKDDIRPLPVDQDELPAETDSGYEPIPHTVSKNPGEIDLVSRMLFVRNDTDPSLIRKNRDLSHDIFIKDQKNVGHENKTVKKDLSQYAKYFALRSDSHTETAGNEVSNSLPVSEALTHQRFPDLKKSESSDDETTLSKDQKSNDDITVEDFKAHVMETRESSESGVLAKHKPFSKIEEIYTESTRRPSITDDDIPTIQTTGDVGNYAKMKSRRRIIYDLITVSNKDLKGQDTSHLKWEGHYMAGRKR